MSELVQWDLLGGRAQVARRRSVTLLTATGVCIGPAPTNPATGWTTLDFGGTLSEVILWGDPTSALRYAVDSHTAAKNNDERALSLAALAVRYVPGPCGSLAIWNASGSTAVVEFECRVNRETNAAGVYPYAGNNWPVTFDEADLTWDSTAITCDATFIP